MTDKSSVDSQGHLGFLISGFASLFVISFIDNSRGPILPLLCARLNIPYQTAGTFLTLGCLAAILSTVLLGYFLKRHCERSVALGIAVVAIIPGILAPFVTSVSMLLLLGAVMGASVALMGTMCNILTIRGSPTHLRGGHLSFQQVMYGAGSLLAPLVFSELIRLQWDWSWLLVGSSFATFILAIVFYRVLPHEAIVVSPRETRKVLSRRAYLMVALFAIYVAGEVLASMWMSTLLVGKQGKSPETAAVYCMVFFLLIGISRFLCYLLVRPHWEMRVLYLSLGCGMLFGLLGQQGQSWALPLIGLLGPFFPLCMARVSRLFPSDWKVMTIHVFVGIQSVLAIMHQSVGSVADSLGIENAFLLSPLLLAAAMVLLYLDSSPH